MLYLILHGSGAVVIYKIYMSYLRIKVVVVVVVVMPNS
jgi:hypothetical protein